jgi:hypothetical protein
MLIINKWWSGLDDVEADVLRAEALVLKCQSRHG